MRKLELAVMLLFVAVLLAVAAEGKRMGMAWDEALTGPWAVFATAWVFRDWLRRLSRWLDSIIKKVEAE